MDVFDVSTLSIFIVSLLLVLRQGSEISIDNHFKHRAMQTRTNRRLNKANSLKYELILSSLYERIFNYLFVASFNKILSSEMRNCLKVFC